ncbi:putative helicase with zinc finger domain [Dufourea novaeangliae]|uniref:Putative helicase with zinc finger domain n=1 Tax=Dufourea novaeangliae TaxID=178035 RepID=A0A154PFY0_DUFNO|nr:putative helicase with zinc finger domain [Dufourea novaeangliae]
MPSQHELYRCPTEGRKSFWGFSGLFGGQFSIEKRWCIVGEGEQWRFMGARVEVIDVFVLCFWTIGTAMMPGWRSWEMLSIECSNFHEYSKFRLVMMADHAVRVNGDMFLSGFADKVHRDWIKSENPETVITCTRTEDVLISASTDLCCRSINIDTVFTWTFRIWARGKRLQMVALSLNQNPKNFVLASVSDSTSLIGVTNGQEWCKTQLQSPAESNTECYVKIGFVANRYGTYRQNVLFYFGEYPVILQRLCMDCVPAEDFARIQNATNYQFSQNPRTFIEGKDHIKRFESPFVPPNDQKEDKLSKIYPYPDRSNFSLTQETLTDDHLTPENYKGRLHELITVEELARHEQIARYNAISHIRLLSHYILTSTGDASTVAKYAPPGELFGQLPLSRSISEDTKSGRLFLRSCNRVLFKCLADDSTSSTIYEAHIEDKCTQMVYIRLSKDCVKMLNLTVNTDLQVQVQFVLNRLSFCEWHRAVDCLPDIGLVFLSKQQLELKDTNILALLDMSMSTIRENWDWLIINSLLNSEQKRALAVMIAPTVIPMPPVLLLGPFGTGKTFTIAQALRILLVTNIKHKILLCTHSNSAADLYVKEFFDNWYKTEQNPRLKPVRIYYKGRAKNTVHPVVREYSLMKENGTFRDPTEADLQDCSLIVTTLATASCLTYLNLSFSHIVIDEAAQALECEVLIPLSLATRQTRLILAGDQMQLAPEIYSDLASERGLGLSLLERIYGMYPQTHLCRIHLCQNYRSHEDIIRFTSEMFYDGIVKPGSNLLVPHPVLHPLTFYAVQGEEIQESQSTGYAHASEACEVASRVLELRNSWPVDRWGPYGEGSIGVLACYAEQVQRIRTELRKCKLPDVSVEGVLNIQGKQFTAVFISTVRTRNCCRYSAERNVKDYGFLTNRRLLNTAMTRAKCLVAVVGDPIALLTIGSCRKLWQRYLEMADLHGTDWATLKYHLSLISELPLTTPLNPLAKEFVPRNQQPMYSVEYVPVLIRYPVVHCSDSWK